jgi:transcription antitermination factor NusB
VTATRVPVPEAVLSSVGLDPTTDDLSSLAATDLPTTLPLFLPTLIGGVVDGSVRTVATVLSRSLPDTAEVMLLDADGRIDPTVETIADLAGALVERPSWVFIPASDVRVEAIGALYAADVLRSDTLETDALSRRAAALASGTWRERAMIDTLIADTAHDWRIDRLNAVDRNILRLGVYELRHTDLATGIIVDQAVEIAKRFSTARSAAFVNGVLDAIAAERHPTRRS